MSKRVTLQDDEIEVICAALELSSKKLDEFSKSTSCVDTIVRKFTPISSRKCKRVMEKLRDVH